MKTLYLATLAILLLLLVPATSAIAQTQHGTISGIVHDEQGGVVPGSSVTLQGTDATYRFTTEIDGAFRFLNLDPGAYRITADLSGFRTTVRDVIIAAGKNVDAPIVLRMADLAETITVTAPAPMLDATQTGTATTISHDELTKIPTSRDPFSLLRTVPGVLLDRVNIGGNETGQAPTVVSKGTRRRT